MPAAELCTGLSASKPASMNRGMIGSITSTFSPDEPCTRAQVVSLYYRVVVIRAPLQGLYATL